MDTDLKFGGPDFCNFCLTRKQKVSSTETETEVDPCMDCGEDHEHCEVVTVTTEVGICEDCVKKLYSTLPK